jgi:hypothetical protein
MQATSPAPSSQQRSSRSFAMWWLVASRDYHQPHQNRSSGRHILPAFFMVNDQAILTGLISY